MADLSFGTVGICCIRDMLYQGYFYSAQLIGDIGDMN